jgi:hypothetical protein
MTDNSVVAYRAFAKQQRETNNETTAIPRRQLRIYATVQEPYLGSGPRAKMEVLLEAVFSMDPLLGYITQPTVLSVVMCS